MFSAKTQPAQKQQRATIGTQTSLHISRNSAYGRSVVRNTSRPCTPWTADVFIQRVYGQIQIHIKNPTRAPECEKNMFLKTRAKSDSTSPVAAKQHIVRSIVFLDTWYCSAYLAAKGKTNRSGVGGHLCDTEVYVLLKQPSPATAGKTARRC